MVALKVPGGDPAAAGVRGGPDLELCGRRFPPCIRSRSHSTRISTVYTGLIPSVQHRTISKLARKTNHSGPSSTLSVTITSPNVQHYQGSTTRFFGDDGMGTNPPPKVVNVPSGWRLRWTSTWPILTPFRTRIRFCGNLADLRYAMLLGSLELYWTDSERQPAIPAWVGFCGNVRNPQNGGVASEYAEDAGFHASGCGYAL